jgi:hypothetical protein
MDKRVEKMKDKIVKRVADKDDMKLKILKKYLKK